MTKGLIELVVDEGSNTPGLKCRIERGQRVLDVCDSLEAPVEFSCRSARCATCMVHVDDPDGWLNDPCADEQRLLKDENAGPKARLACQLYIRASPRHMNSKPNQGSTITLHTDLNDPSD